jgi:predicted Zn-dependent protease
MAEAYFRRASEASPDLLDPRLQAVEVLVARLTVDAVADRPVHEEVAVAVAEALRVDPFMPMVRKNLAESLYQTGRREDAMRELETAIRTEPHFIPGYLRLAEWKAAEGNGAEARRLESEAAVIMERFAGESNLTDYERMLLGRTATPPETAESGL